MSRVTCPSCGYSNNPAGALTCNMCGAVLQRADKEGSGKGERPKPKPKPEPKAAPRSESLRRPASDSSNRILVPGRTATLALLWLVDTAT